MSKLNKVSVLSYSLLLVFILILLTSCDILKTKNSEKKVEIPITQLPEPTKVTPQPEQQTVEIIDIKPLGKPEPTEPVELSNKIILITGATTEYPDLKDTIMLGKIDIENKKLKLLSIPRDICVEFSDDEINEFENWGVKMPKQVKISQITGYLKGHDEITYLRKRIEEILDIKIDYYMDMDTKVFRDIVDELGGIEIVVPKGGFYYKDPYYTLEVDLKEGKQILNGNDAESFVRFRTGYEEGDLTRIKVQRQFLEKFFEKLLDNKNMYIKTSLIFNNVLSNTNTNFTLSTLLSYYTVASSFSKKDLVFYDLPLIKKGLSSGFLFLDKEKTKILISEEFK